MKTTMTTRTSTVNTTATTESISHTDAEVMVITSISYSGTHKQYFTFTVTQDRRARTPSAASTTPTSSSTAPTSPNIPPSPTLSCSAPPTRLHRLLKHIDFSKWGVSNTDHPLETGTATIYLFPHVYDCVKNMHTCLVLLPIIGACCGILFGCTLYPLLQWLLPKYWAHRKAKKAAKAALEAHAQKAGRDAADERRTKHFQSEAIRKFMAGGGKVKKPGWFVRKVDPDVMDVNPDGSYG
jgi:hypothetical protein